MKIQTLLTWKTLSRKAKFRFLDEVTYEENFDVLKEAENKQYNFSTANKQF